ncbi:MAG: aromatic ring-hydroxylating dioxygenase subunit alpha [Hyphomicrobiales bacterium]
MNVIANVVPTLSDDRRAGLPSWTYFNQELLEVEKQELFRKCWQLACHVSDVPKPGDYQCFDIVGERAIIVRGKDDKVRAFHNVCRHRGSRVVAEQKGRCKSAIVCPFHGWSFNLDGTLRAVPQAKTFPKLDPVQHGLVPLEYEIWYGFVFVRFIKSDQPPVATLMAAQEEMIRHYRLEEVKPYTGLKNYNMPVNWKAVRDVDNEGYHVPVAHPALNDLYGSRYADFSVKFGVSRSEGQFNEGQSRYWSVKNYKKTLPPMKHLPEELQKKWFYFGLFPNLVLMLYPDLIGFYQEYPVAIDKTVQRIAYYALDDDRREVRASRYLARRIDEITGAEDTQLIIWSWESMQSSGYKGMILSDLEAGVRNYHDALRQMLPVMSLDRQPSEGTVSTLNASLRQATPNPWRAT